MTDNSDDRDAEELALLEKNRDSLVRNIRGAVAEFADRFPPDQREALEEMLTLANELEEGEPEDYHRITEKLNALMSSLIGGLDTSNWN